MDLSISDTKQAEQFITLLKHINIISTNITIYFKEDSVFCQGMDPSHICLFEFTIGKEWFYSYSLKNGPFSIGLNTIILSKIVNTHKKGQLVIMNTESHEADKLGIVFKYMNEEVDSKFDKEFEVPLMDINEDLLEIPDKEYAVDLGIESNIFDKLCSEFAVFNDVLRIKCTEKKIQMSASGLEGKMKVNIDIDDLNEFSIEEGLEYDDTYSLTYFNRMCVFHKLSDDMTMNFEKDRPMKMTYQIDELFKVIFYLGAKCDD